MGKVGELWFLAGRGELYRVKSLLAQGVDVNERSSQGETALKAAAWKGHDEVVSLLIDNGADVNADGGQSPLVMAVWERHLKTVELLIKAGADVNVKYTGEPLLFFAYSPKSSESRTPEREGVDRQVVRMLLEAGANPDQRDDSSGWTFLMRCREPELLKLAIEKGGDVNAVAPERGNPVLFFHLSHPENLKLLLSSGADPELRDHDGYTPLMNAAHFGRVEAVKLLIEHGAKVDATAEHKIYRGQEVDALKLALEGKHTEVINILRKNKKGFFGRLFGG
jgi:ankyrin repeat protein